MNKRFVSGSALVALLILASGCSIFQRPTPVPPPATSIPQPPPSALTEVAQTLTAIAVIVTPGAQTPIPAPTQATVAPPPTQTTAPGQPTPTPAPTEDLPPTVQLVAPTANQQISAGQTLSVIALAADNAGIASVEFYADNVLYSTQTPPQGTNPTTFQATFPWSSNAVGNHSLYVIAYDTSGNVSSPAAVPVNIVADNSPPSVQILAPTTPQTLNPGAQLLIQVVATDESAVTQLQMLVDNQPYSQSNAPTPAGLNPFSATFTYAANTAGAHTILIRATDLAGNIGASQPLSVNVVDNQGPAVSTSYSSYSVVIGQPVYINTVATDSAGIQRIELWADGGLWNTYTSPNPPAQTSLSIQQNWSSGAPGNHTLFTKAYDTNGQVTTTPQTNILVVTPQQPTWTPQPPPPTRTPRPTWTPTNPPPPPTNIEMRSPGTNFQDHLPDPIHIVVDFHNDAGLRTLEVYVQYSGTMATPIHVEDANGARDRHVEFEYTPPSAGVIAIFATAVDVYGQRAEGPHIPGVVHEYVPPPIIPTRTPERPQRPNIDGGWRGEINNGFFALALQPRIGCSETSCSYGGTFEDKRGEESVRGDIASGQYDGSHLSLRVEGAQPGDVTWTFEGEVTANGGEIVGEWTESRAGIPSLQRGSVSFRR